MPEESSARRLAVAVSVVSLATGLSTLIGGAVGSFDEVWDVGLPIAGVVYQVLFFGWGVVWAWRQPRKEMTLLPKHADSPGYSALVFRFLLENIIRNPEQIHYAVASWRRDLVCELGHS